VIDGETLTRWYKMIRTVHELNRKQVVEIMRLGGIEISGSRADGWVRSQADTHRRNLITPDEFEAFLAGLLKWTRPE
jgi:hypothetical protein